jgi:hypothetical protein
VVDDMLVTTNYGSGTVAVHELSQYGRIGALKTCSPGIHARISPLWTVMTFSSPISARI